MTTRHHLLVLAALAGAVSGYGPERLAAQEPPAEATAAEAEREAGDAREESEEPDSPPRPRRRPRLDSSNTGYIDNAIVGTALRLRYDSASGADRPDRAEFIYGKCLCFSGFGQDAASPGPTANLDFEELQLSYEHAFGRRVSLFVEVPFRRVDVDLPAGFAEVFGLPDVDASGLGDVRAGFKYALVADPDRYLTLQLKTYFASGDAARALGTDHASIEPGILYHRRLSRRWAVASEARWWHPLAGSSDPATGASDPNSPVGRIERIPPPLAPPDGAVGPDAAVRNDNFAGDVLRLGVGVSRESGGGRVRWTPVVELVGWYFVDGYQTPGTDLAIAADRNPDGTLANPPGYVLEADNDTVLNLKLGARLRGGFAGSVYLGYGLALTDDVLYDGVFRLEYRVGLSRRETREPRWTARSAASSEPDRDTEDGRPESAEAAEAAPPRPLGEPAAAPRPVALDQGRAVAPAAPREPPRARGERATSATPEEDVVAALHRWSEAWSARRVADYLACYSSTFQPAQGMSLPAWRAQRRVRLSAPSFIRVSLDEIAVALQGPARATVAFTQRYESNTYRDTVRKRLVMVREGDAWKIVREETSP